LLRRLRDGVSPDCSILWAGPTILDFASRTSLATAVNLYLRCGEFAVGGYLSFAGKQRKGAFRSDLRAVKKTWKL